VKGLFITGTDTGVGKTFVACALARAARAAGHRVFAFKPIETGCELRAGELVGSDQSLLVEAAGGWQQGVLRGTYQFRKPASPLVAARAFAGMFQVFAVSQELLGGKRIFPLSEAKIVSPLTDIFFNGLRALPRGPRRPARGAE